MWCERRSPPCGKAVTRPSTRQARAQRTALDTAMPKRAAAALQERPPSTAAITRERRSWDKARVMRRALKSEHPLVTIHAETGERVLFASPSFLKSIVGLTPRESANPTFATRPE